MSVIGLECRESFIAWWADCRSQRPSAYKAERGRAVGHITHWSIGDAAAQYPLYITLLQFCRKNTRHAPYVSHVPFRRLQYVSAGPPGAVAYAG